MCLDLNEATNKILVKHSSDTSSNLVISFLIFNIVSKKEKIKYKYMLDFMLKKLI